MQGPFIRGTLINPIDPSEWDWETNRLVRGQSYRVIKAFVDADGDRHSIGEEWCFITSMFSRFEDELVICVRSKADEEWKVPMVWTPNAQQEIIENFNCYVVPALSD